MAAAMLFGGESPAQERRVNAIWSYQDSREVLVVWNQGGCDKAKASCVTTGLRVVETHRAGGYHVCKCPVNISLPETVKKLKKDAVIAHVESNVVLRLREPKKRNTTPVAKSGPAAIPPRLSTGLRRLPSDPGFAFQWGMENIYAPQAWNCVRTSPLIVAVIDSGVDYNHEDLRENMWRNPGEVAGDGRDNDGNGFVDDLHGVNMLSDTSDPMDENGHGTHCAGVIGAVGSNRAGVTGVAWSVKIMAVKVFDAEGTTNLNAIIKGIDYAWRNGARVANCSFSGSTRSKLQRDAIARAAAAGMLIVSAAGNEGGNNDQTPSYPGSFGDPMDSDGPLGNVISVGSITPADTLSDFSNFGQRSVHLCAPGGAGGKSNYENILSTISAKNSNDFGAFPGGKYGYTAGTSMAAPHVAGAIALILGHPSYWNASTSQVKDVILSRTRRQSSLNGKCTTGGTLDLSFLCTALSQQSTPPRERQPLVLPRSILPRR